MTITSVGRHTALRPPANRAWPRMVRHLLAGAFAALCCAVAPGLANERGPISTPLTIMAPSAPGSALDQTARATADALTAARIADNIQITNVPGADGMTALSRLLNPPPPPPVAHGRAHARQELMVVALPLLVRSIQDQRKAASGKDAGNKDTATSSSAAPGSVLGALPIARLTAEPLVLAVAADSNIRDATDLARRLRDDPSELAWSGRAAGSVDHIAAALFAAAIGADPRTINYVPFQSSSEALNALLRGQVQVSAGSTAEFEGQVAAGRLRLIGNTGPQARGAVPSFREQGIDLQLSNWRGVVAAPSARAGQAALAQAFSELSRSPAWTETLHGNRWTGAYLDASAFAAFLREEEARIGDILGRIGLAASVR